MKKTNLKKKIVKISKLQQDPYKKPIYMCQKKTDHTLLNFKIFEIIFLILVLTFILAIGFSIYYLSNINEALYQYNRLPQYMYDLTKVMQQIITSNKELHIRMTTLENHIIVLTQVIADSNSLENTIIRNASTTAVILFGTVAIIKSTLVILQIMGIR